MLFFDSLHHAVGEPVMLPGPFPEIVPVIR